MKPYHEVNKSTDKYRTALTLQINFNPSVVENHSLQRWH